MNLHIKIIGLGKVGKNALDFFPENTDSSIELMLIDTDLTNLQKSKHKTHLAGQNITHGLPARDLELAKKIVEYEEKFLKTLVEQTDVLFLVTSLGGNTGVTFAKALTKIAKEKDIFTIIFANLPCVFEGQKKQELSYKHLLDLRKNCNMTIEFSNDMVFQKSPEDATMIDALNYSSQSTSKAILALSNALTYEGANNFNLEQLKNILNQKCAYNFFGTASSSLSHPETLVEKLIQCPFLDFSKLSKTKSELIIHLNGGSNTEIATINSITRSLKTKMHPSSKIIISFNKNHLMNDILDLILIGVPILPNSSLKSSKTPLGHRENNESFLEKNEQLNFEFIHNTANRGYFDATDHNLINEEDIDIPTYLRKGIRIKS